ncbi:MAG: MobF family relaxase [Owenweeksia sp.]
MLRIIVSMSAEAAKNYFSDALSKSDYYLSDQELPGRWHGLGASRLGLEGEVQKEQFFALAENRDPRTGSALTPGGNRAQRRVGYDINFHCPKSISILHGMGVDERILPAFEQSVAETMRDMERDMQARVRKGGQYDDRDTGNMIWAQFIHQTARPTENAPPDPHLHAHCYTFNATYDHVEDRFKAGQFVKLKRDGMYYQALFHKRLADQMEGLGFTVKKTKDAFEVVDVPDDVRHIFSKRTDHIGRVAAELGVVDKKELDALGARTRAAKQKEMTMPDLQQFWKKQLKGQNLLQSVKGKSIDPYSVEQCKDHALLQCFERKSVAADRAVLQEAVRHSIGSKDITIDQVCAGVVNDPRLVTLSHKGQMFVTTRDVLSEERDMVDLALTGQGQSKPFHLIPCDDWRDMRLSQEQRKTVNHVLLNKDSIILIQGRAGTGKTTLMTEVTYQIKKSGKHVHAFAPTAEASRKVLREEGFQKADTVARLLTDKDLQKRIKGQVVWIDEAGLIGSRDMGKILKLADKQNARVILTGDDRQHQAVARGDAFRLLHEVANLPVAGTRTIYRQKQEAYREVVSDLSDGKTKQAFNKLERMKAVKEMDPASIPDTLTHDYLTCIKAGKTALVISPTHKERETVNRSIRAELRQHRLIGRKDRAYTKLQSYQWTVAQKQDVVNYQPGMAVQVHLKISKELERGTKATVDRVYQNNIWVTTDKGERVKLPLDKAERFDVYQRKTLPLAGKEHIRITKNSFDANRSRLDNGQMLEIIGFVKDGTIRARTARGVPGAKNKRQLYKEYRLAKDFENFDHAYCQTSYASQGKTVDRVLIHQPAATFPATSSEQFYVSVSRGREMVTIYTDDKEDLLIHAETSGRRLSAIEMQLPVTELYPESKPGPDTAYRKNPDKQSEPDPPLSTTAPEIEYPDPQQSKRHGRDYTL